MRRNRDITAIDQTPAKPKRKSREWFEQKVSELGESVKQLPADRQQQFDGDVLKESSVCKDGFPRRGDQA